jgi:hypothetical protein
MDEERSFVLACGLACGNLSGVPMNAFDACVNAVGRSVNLDQEIL